MYVCYDVKRGELLYRCEKVETVRALINIELSHTASSIWEETNLSFYNVFDISHLQSMFKGITGGTEPHSFNREYLVGQIIRLCQSAEPTNVDAFEATVQSLQIVPTDRTFYQYVKGSNKARVIAEPCDPPALLGNWQVAQGLPLPNNPMAHASCPQSPAIAQTWATVQTVAPKYAPPWV